MHLLRLQQHLEVLFSPDINCVVTDITTMILQQNKFLSSCVAVISFFLFVFFKIINSEVQTQNYRIIFDCSLRVRWITKGS